MKPQEPGQGSRHFWLIHAKWVGHSLLLMHWGLQLGGIPINSDKQEQDGVSPFTWHCEFGPHGDGTHGSIGSGGKAAEMLWMFLNYNSDEIQKKLFKIR